MKILFLLIGIALISAASVGVYVYAQPGGRRPPPRDPILELFDTDGDEELSSAEIDKSAEALRANDRDQDGVLTRDELPRPPRGNARDEDRRPPRRVDEQPNADRLVAEQSLQDAPAGAVVISGGYRTDPRDGGRPVALIAAALGVKEQVFRDAFSGVTPSSFGPPTGSRARANKTVLMDALGPHGVTNDRLDEVSNHYRYRAGSGRLWEHRPATVTANIEDGKVVGFKITDAGAGYMTAPTIQVKGQEQLQVKAEIEFTTDLKTNGQLSTLTIVSQD